jgi:isoquinoline 1-oxidoreductase subunit beta
MRISRGASRCRFLRAAAAVGRGLVLSLKLPFANGETEASDADGFAPNAFVRVTGAGNERTARRHF